MSTVNTMTSDSISREFQWKRQNTNESNYILGVCVHLLVAKVDPHSSGCAINQHYRICFTRLIRHPMAFCIDKSDTLSVFTVLMHSLLFHWNFHWAFSYFPTLILSSPLSLSLSHFLFVATT